MGLLDDAIKEHLELKRKHGADAEEVARLEQEALGPPQRGEFAGASAPAEPAEPDEPAAVGAGAPPPAPVEEAAPPAAEPVEPEPLPEPEPDPEREPGARVAPAWLDDEEPEPEGEPAVRAEPAAEPAGQAEGSGDDVLEETPEFLQETPEHDRLWFEQKPPRDFDLDR